MRFSDTGYYIERYVKCDNCGELIYGTPIVASDGKGGGGYCSEWCREWARQRASGVAVPRVPLPRTARRQ
jgi:hypothetical protein